VIWKSPSAPVEPASIQRHSLTEHSSTFFSLLLPKSYSNMAHILRSTLRGGSSMPTTTTRPASMSGRQRLPVSNAIGFSNAPVEVIVGGGIFVAGSLAFLVSEAIKASNLDGAQPDMGPKDSLAVEAPLPRKDAVLIFGASGRSGREIVSKVWTLRVAVL